MTPPKKIDNFTVPRWWECGWRRVPCNKKDCRVCGRVLRDRDRHLIRGTDPDGWEVIGQDIRNSFEETTELIKEEVEEMGLDWEEVRSAAANFKKDGMPNLRESPIYRKVARWRSNIYQIAEVAMEDDELWLESEMGADLMWYKNTLVSKIFRQLTNCWDLSRGERSARVDYFYTRYVLGECIAILKKSLRQLSLLQSGQKAELMLSFAGLRKLEQEILSI